LKYFKPRDYINRQHGNTRRELVANLSDEDLISVFKALVWNYYNKLDAGLGYKKE